MALTLFEKIVTIYPALIERDKWEGIVLEDNAIKTWSHSSYSKPTTSQLNAVTEAQVKVVFYKGKRAAEYPSVVDQLDDIYHNGIDAWKATIKTTKDKYPKP